MNLVGKIFIVLIFVMSICWMITSVAVYSTHQNWKDLVENPDASSGKPLGLKPQLQQAQERNQELKDQKTNLEEELALAKAAKRQALNKLEQENTRVQGELDLLREEHASLVEDANQALADMRATRVEEAALLLEIAGGVAPDGTQVVGLRNQNRAAQAERDKYFADSVKLTEQLHQARNLYQTLRTRSDELGLELADAKVVLQKHDLKAIPVLYEEVVLPVDGVVEKVAEDGMVEISIGADDGLMQNHTLEVVRKDGGVSTYMGRVQVTKTSPDKAVCKVLPEFLQRPIQRGDRVVSKLR